MDIDLSPSQAAQPAAEPVHLKAIEAEATRGTEQASFRVPGRMRTLINRLLNDPRFGFNSQPSRFYLQAVATHLVSQRQFFADDPEYVEVTDQLVKLSRELRFHDLVARFEEPLVHAEKLAPTWKHVDDLPRALETLTRFVQTVNKVPGTAGIECRKRLRASTPLRDLLNRLIVSDDFGASDAVHALRDWFSEAD